MSELLPDPEQFSDWNLGAPEEIAAPESPAAEPVEAAADAPAPVPVSREEFERLQHEHAEAQKLIGRQGQESGELRQQQQQEPEPQGYDLSGTGDIDDPIQARNLAVIAAQQGDWINYDRLIRTYADYDQFGASALHADIRAQQTQQQALQQMQPQIEQAQQYAARQAQESAISDLASKHPDIGDVLGSIDPERTQIPQEILAGLNSPNPSSALTTLYWWAKGQRVDQIQNTNQQVAAQDDAANEQAKARAGVATSSAPVTDTPGDDFADVPVYGWDDTEVTRMGGDWYTNVFLKPTPTGGPVEYLQERPAR